MKYLVGIISDTHDHLDNVKKIVKFFNEYSVRHVFHLGDFNSDFIVKELRALKCPFNGILGETEGDYPSLLKLCSSNMKINSEKELLLEIEGKKILLIRDPLLIANSLEMTQPDYIFTGKTHTYSIERKKKSVIINPGELCGYLTGEASAVILDLIKSDYERIRL